MYSQPRHTTWKVNQCHADRQDGLKVLVFISSGDLVLVFFLAILPSWRLIRINFPIISICKFTFLTINSSTLSMKYFSDFSISYRKGSLSKSRVSGLKAAKGVSKAA